MDIRHWLGRSDLLINGAKQLVPGTGPLDAKLMFVGEAPGEDEDNQGVPFIGRCGNLLDDMLGKANIDRQDVYITNVVKARPTKKDANYHTQLRNRAPTEAEVQQHKDWLWEEILEIRPKVIVCLGKVPTKLLFKIETSFTMRRYLLSTWDSKELWGPKSYNCWLRAAWHPSYLLQHGRQYINDEIGYFKEALEYSEK